MAHVRQGDTVVVISGKEKGKTGKVLRILTKKDRVVIQGIMMVKRHTKPSQKNPQGGIVDKEGSVHISNVALWSESRKAPMKVGYKTGANGSKVRVDKKTGEEIPSPAIDRK